MIRARIGLLVSSALFVATPLRGDGPPLPKDSLDAADLSGESKLGLPDAIPGIENSPLATARLRLGRKLFFDPILSIDRTVACASCHEPEKGFASGEARPLGVQGRRCARNAPTLFNRALGTAQMWDGRAPTLEAQVLLPIQNENEMALPLKDALARLAESPEYRELFAAAGAAAPDADSLARALAEFVRRLLLGDSVVDRFKAAKEADVTPAERRGMWIFESKGHCWKCHSGPNFSDESFHDTGIGAKDGAPEEARFAVTRNESDRGRFKTATLRGLVKTAPYMHDGSLATLEEVVQYYQRGGNPNSNLDPEIKPLDLSDEDAAGLVAFLRALSRPGAPPESDER